MNTNKVYAKRVYFNEHGVILGSALRKEFETHVKGKPPIDFTWDKVVWPSEAEVGKKYDIEIIVHCTEGEGVLKFYEFGIFNDPSSPGNIIIGTVKIPPGKYETLYRAGRSYVKKCDKPRFYGKVSFDSEGTYTGYIQFLWEVE